MSESDKEFITKLATQLAANEKKDRAGTFSGTDLGDMAFKALTTITMMLTIWVVSSLQDLSQTVSNIQIDNEYTKTSVESIKLFTEKPRFTEEEFNSKIEPLIKQLNMNTTELNVRTKFIEETRSQLLRHDLRIETLEKSVK